MVDPTGDGAQSPQPSDEESGGVSGRRYEPLPAPPPVPPDALKPWYYQGWFLVPTFVWWPCSAVLFIRSPWHNGVVSGALSWAWIIVGGGWIFLRTQLHLQNGEGLVDPTLLALVAPGIVLTVVTQSLWLLRDRPRIRRIRDAGGFAAYEGRESGDPMDARGRPTADTRNQPEGPRRRSNRRSVRSRRRRR